MATDLGLRLGKGKHLRPFPPIRVPTSQEIAYLAGLLEGEGYFGCHQHHKRRAGGTYRQLAIAMAMTDEDVVRKAHSIMNIGRVIGPHNRGFKDTWRWNVSHPQGFMTIVGAIWPYLGERRRLQIKKALLEWRAAP